MEKTCQPFPNRWLSIARSSNFAHVIQSVSLFLTVKPPGKLVEHIVTHILHDPMVKARYCPCGFCGGSGDSCVVYIAKGKGSQGA
jgi:hypothetical protein